MRILHISCQKPDSTGSGVFLAALVRSYARMGHENAVICGVMEGDHPEKSLEPGTAIFPVKFKTPELPFPICGMSDVMPYESTRYRDLDEAMAGQFERAFLDAIMRADQAMQPDLVICHHLYFVTALAREALPHRSIVAISHSTDLRQLVQHGLMRERIFPAVGFLDGVAALHEAQREEIAQLFGMDPGSIAVVGVGFDSSAFTPSLVSAEQQRVIAERIIVPAVAAETARFFAEGNREQFVQDTAEVSERTLLSASGPIVLYVGKIGYKKGVKSLVRAFHEVQRAHPGASLVLVGVTRTAMSTTPFACLRKGWVIASASLERSHQRSWPSCIVQRMCSFSHRSSRACRWCWPRRWPAVLRRSPRTCPVCRNITGSSSPGRLLGSWSHQRYIMWTRPEKRTCPLSRCALQRQSSRK